MKDIFIDFEENKKVFYCPDVDEELNRVDVIVWEDVHGFRQRRINTVSLAWLRSLTPANDYHDDVKRFCLDLVFEL